MQCPAATSPSREVPYGRSEPGNGTEDEMYIGGVLGLVVVVLLILLLLGRI